MAAIKEENGEKVVTDYWKEIEGANPHQKAIFHCTKLIVLRNLPINFVQDKPFRQFGNYEGEKICEDTLKEVLFCLTELFEQRIKAEMKAAGKVPSCTTDGRLGCALRWLFCCLQSN